MGQCRHLGRKAETLMFAIQPTQRLRPSPFYQSAVAEGLTAANVYNRMIMPPVTVTPRRNIDG